MIINNYLIFLDMIDIYNDISFFYLMGNHQIYPYFVKTINNHEILHLIFII